MHDACKQHVAAKFERGAVLQVCLAPGSHQACRHNASYMA